MPPVLGKVLNVNFPDTMHSKALIEQTSPSKIYMGSLYERNENGSIVFVTRKEREYAIIRIVIEMH